MSTQVHPGLLVSGIALLAAGGSFLIGGRIPTGIGLLAVGGILIVASLFVPPAEEVPGEHVEPAPVKPVPVPKQAPAMSVESHAEVTHLHEKGVLSDTEAARLHARLSRR